MAISEIIERSVRRHGIVTIGGTTDSDINDLVAAADHWNEVGGVVEFTGRDDAGLPWQVHVAQQPSSGDFWAVPED